MSLSRNGLEAKVTLISFADSRLEHALRRLVRQGKRFRTFSRISTFNEDSLDGFFRDKHQFALSPEIRGYGYWVWKPQVILQSLQQCEIGEFVVYVDAGCHLNHKGESRLRDYLSIAKEGATGILAFELARNGNVIHKEISWNKADTLRYFGVDGILSVTETAQIEATVIIIEKRSQTIRFFQEWLDVMESHPNLSDDSPSVIPNSPDFIEHRHDQSVFSLLAKRHGVSVLSFSENFPQRRTLLARKPAWSDLRDYPIHARRDKTTFLQAIINDFMNGLKFIFLLRFRHRLTSQCK